MLTLNTCELTACLRLRPPTGHMIFLKSPKITAFLDSDSIGQGQLLFHALHESGFGELTTVSPLSVTFQRLHRNTHTNTIKGTHNRKSVFMQTIFDCSHRTINARSKKSSYQCSETSNYTINWNKSTVLSDKLRVYSHYWKD